MAPNQHLDITYQTLYSELVQRSLDESFTSEFSSNGRFVAVEVKGKKYWYFDTPKPKGGGQDRRYVGPVDDPEITKRVEAFKDLCDECRRIREVIEIDRRGPFLVPTVSERSSATDSGYQNSRRSMQPSAPGGWECLPGYGVLSPGLPA